MRKFLFSVLVAFAFLTHGLITVNAASSNLPTSYPFELQGKTYVFDVPTYVGDVIKVTYRSDSNYGQGKFYVNGISSPSSGMSTKKTYTFTMIEDNPVLTLTGANTTFGSLVYSIAINDVELDITVDLTPPNPVKGVTVEPLVNALNISWLESTEEDLAGYNVYLNGVKRNSSLIISPNVLLSDLAVMNYAVQVTAVDLKGNESIKSSVVYASPLEEVIKPTLQVSNIKDTSVRLTWDKVGKEFLIYKDDVLIKKQTTTFLDVTNLQPESSYNFYVVSIDRYNRQIESDHIVVKTLALMISKPILKLSNVTNSSAVLTMENGTSGSVFDIYLNDVFITSISNSQYMFSGLDEDSLYRIKVIARLNNQSIVAETSFTTKSAPVPMINSAKLSVSTDDRTKRNLSYTHSNGVTGVKVYINGQLIGTYPVDQDIELDFSDLSSKMAELEIIPVDPDGVGYKSTYPVDSTGDAAIDDITTEMTESYSLIKKAFLYLAIASIPFILIVVLFFWIRKRMKPMFLSADDSKPFAPAVSTNPKANYNKSKNFSVDQTKDERFIYQPKLPKKRKSPKGYGFEVVDYKQKYVPVGFMGSKGYKKKTDITYRKDGVLYKQKYVKGQGQVLKPIDSINKVKHVSNQIQSVKRFVSGSYKSK